MNSLIDRFCKYSPFKIEVIIHQYQSKRLKIVRKKNRWIFYLHTLFLEAPDQIVKAIIQYAQSRKSEDHSLIKQFVYAKQNELDLSHTLNKKKLVTKGRYFDLKQIYSSVNQRDFENKMNLEITWFYPRYRTYRHITFGQYDRCLKLIKINHYLDTEKTPHFFMDYLIYHEMLHEKSPPYMDQSGRCRIHTKEFKALEKNHPFIRESKQWEKTFLKEFWRSNGRTQ